MKEWSNKWVSSRQPRKQRKYRYNAPLHVRQKFVSAHLSEVLRGRFGKRSLPLRKGDEVKVMRGSDKGFKGKIERIDLKEGKVYIEGLNVKKVDGSEVLKPKDPSNLLITESKMEDKRRQMIVERSREKEEEKAKKKGE
ncbi:MAG: 50S ribosomal protein L24 [Candidatus Aenigmarchaeota archaeon]|nr:50S ribosomal protein L24 [Candidatus Aenigmarchaeota archaeon]MCK4531823.1 50S ribosomal protein L24 [Candidatus Aenigmarchaeota archaeon]